MAFSFFGSSIFPGTEQEEERPNAQSSPRITETLAADSADASPASSSSSSAAASSHPATAAAATLSLAPTTAPPGTSFATFEPTAPGPSAPGSSSQVVSSTPTLFGSSSRFVDRMECEQLTRFGHRRPVVKMGMWKAGGIRTLGGLLSHVWMVFAFPAADDGWDGGTDRLRIFSLEVVTDEEQREKRIVIKGPLQHHLRESGGYQCIRAAEIAHVSFDEILRTAVILCSYRKHYTNNILKSKSNCQTFATDLFNALLVMYPSDGDPVDEEEFAEVLDDTISSDLQKFFIPTNAVGLPDTPDTFLPLSDPLLSLDVSESLLYSIPTEQPIWISVLADRLTKEPFFVCSLPAGHGLNVFFLVGTRSNPPARIFAAPISSLARLEVVRRKSPKSHLKKLRYIRASIADILFCAKVLASRFRQEKELLSYSKCFPNEIFRVLETECPLAEDLNPETLLDSIA